MKQAEHPGLLSLLYYLPLFLFTVAVSPNFTAASLGQSFLIIWLGTPVVYYMTEKSVHLGSWSAFATHTYFYIGAAILLIQCYFLSGYSDVVVLLLLSVAVTALLSYYSVDRLLSSGLFFFSISFLTVNEYELHHLFTVRYIFPLLLSGIFLYGIIKNWYLLALFHLLLMGLLLYEERWAFAFLSLVPLFFAVIGGFLGMRRRPSVVVVSILLTLFFLSYTLFGRHLAQAL